MSQLSYPVEDCSKHPNSGLAGMHCILWQNDMHTQVSVTRAIESSFT